MNRWDNIKGAALDVAQHVTQDPKQRDAMANNLITLIGLMVNAVGKGVAIEGESDMNDVADWTAPWDDGSFDPNPEQVAEFETERATDSAKAHNRYLVGEEIQRQADHVAGSSRTANLQRWVDLGPGYGWHPRCAECGERDGHMADCPGRSARCTECNRFLQYGHMSGCSQRKAVTVAEDICGGTADGPSCDWDPDCPNAH